jgi:hypothetical protein
MGSLDSQCGAIVVWSNPNLGYLAGSWKKKAGKAIAFLGGGFLLGKLLWMVF